VLTALARPVLAALLLTRLILTALLLLARLVLAALLRIALILLTAALRILLLVRHWDALRFVVGWKWLKTPPGQTTAQMGRGSPILSLQI
jgi:hypothetical protein